MDTLGGIANAAELKPILASIPDACKYIGGVSRAKLYADLLPRLDTVHIGSRHFIVVASLDRLIQTLNTTPPQSTNKRPPQKKRGGRPRKEKMSDVTRRLNELTGGPSRKTA